MSIDIRRIYITHCSAKKDSVLKNTKAKVTPDKLYTAAPTQRFINECKNKGVNWAIFSDKYGVWFSDTRIRSFQEQSLERYLAKALDYYDLIPNSFGGLFYFLSELKSSPLLPSFLLLPLLFSLAASALLFTNLS